MRIDRSADLWIGEQVASNNLNLAFFEDVLVGLKMIFYGIHDDFHPGPN